MSSLTNYKLFGITSFAVELFVSRSSISFFIQFVVRTHLFKRSICFPVISLYDVFVYTLPGHSFYVVVIICL